MDTENQEYISHGLETHDVVMIDSSSILNPNINKFIENSKEQFIAHNRQIVVKKGVCYELARFLGSDDSRLSNAAMNALELMKKYPNIFSVENNDMDENEISHAFADKEIYNCISSDRSTHSHLLISNDRNLSSDVFNLNELKSIKGKNIWVCFINYFGELQMCECAKIRKKCEPEAVEEVKPSEDISIIESTEELNNDNSNKLFWVGASCGLGGAIMGFCVGKWGKVAFNTLRACMV